MKYVALLRGINVGGKSLIKMNELKAAIEKSGYGNVMTYIQSGNVMFESEIRNSKSIEENLETVILKTFRISTSVITLSSRQYRNVLESVPGEWLKPNDLRMYIAFVKQPVTPQDVLHELKMNEMVDSADIGQGAVFMSTKLSGLTKSGFNKLIGTKVYKAITIRNYNTSRKLLELMDRK